MIWPTLECDIKLVEAWLEGVEEVPLKASAWIETLAKVHEAVMKERPKSMKGKRFKGVQ